MQEILFVSLGMVVLDELRIPGLERIKDSVGGSGIYSTLGARFFLPKPRSLSVAFTVRAGNDFPAAVKDKLELWDITLEWIEEQTELSTRGLLTYKDDTLGPKSFQYTTPRLLISPKHLCESALSSKSFHFLCSPEELEADVDELLKLRRKLGVIRRPLILWEPAPLSCKFQNLEACMRAAHLIDVFSPNHIELAQLCGASEKFDPTNLKALISRFLESGVGPDEKGSVVVRAGEHGQVIGSRNSPTVFLPPFHSDASAVRDTTGAGNAFLGAYAIGLLETQKPIEAAYYGSVASSVVIENTGMPSLDVVEGQELWGGVHISSRFEIYRKTIETRMQ